MKKLIALALVAAFVLSMGVGCGNTNTAPTGKTGSTSTATPK